jgi:membrane-associated phospholipid phosphatase
VTENGAALSARPEGEKGQFGRSNAAERRSSDATATGREARLFRAPSDSVAQRLADRFATLHPAVAGAIALAIGYAALAVATIAAGFLLVEVVLTGSVLDWDNDVVDWLAEHRTPLGVDLSWVGSHLAETATVLAVVAVVVLILCFRRRFVAAVFFVSAIAVEAATYLATTLVIDRPRPHVVRFEKLGSGASYPSGHTAASVVIYVGIAMLVLAYVKSRAARVTAVVIAVVAPAAVALARMYRGMHHPIDVISGALIGLGCLCVGLLVARVFNTLSERRRREEAKS